MIKIMPMHSTEVLKKYKDKHIERNRGLTGPTVLWTPVEGGILGISFNQHRYSNTFTPVMSASRVVQSTSRLQTALDDC